MHCIQKYQKNQIPFKNSFYDLAHYYKGQVFDFPEFTFRASRSLKNQNFHVCMLPQMSAFMKCFGNGGKNMFFMIKDNSALVKQNEICDKIKELIGKKIHSKPIYDGKYIKTKITLFDSVICPNFYDSQILREGTYYVCSAKITIDSVMKTDNSTTFQYI